MALASVIAEMLPPFGEIVRKSSITRSSRGKLCLLATPHTRSSSSACDGRRRPHRTRGASSADQGRPLPRVLDGSSGDRREKTQQPPGVVGAATSKSLKQGRGQWLRIVALSLIPTRSRKSRMRRNSFAGDLRFGFLRVWACGFIAVCGRLEFRWDWSCGCYVGQQRLHRDAIH
jgi:hypothetical protein